MRTLALLTCLALAGCEPADTRLVCAIDGREVFRSQPVTFWKNTDGVWWTRGGNERYQPSRLESCRTVRDRS